MRQLKTLMYMIREKFIKVKRLEITTKIGCSNRCVYCPQEIFIKNYNDNNKMMSVQSFKNILSSVPLFVRIDFSGMSEPFSNPDCVAMIMYANTMGYKISVYTTGNGLTKLMIDMIRNIKFTKFVLHLPDKERNMKIKDDDRYYEALRYLHDAKINNFTIMTMGTITDKAKEIFGNLPKSEMHSRAGNLNDIKSNYTTGPITCVGNDLPVQGVVLPNGDVLLCCMDYKQKYIIGNLLKETFVDMYTRKPYMKYMNDMRKNNSVLLCRRCIYAKKKGWCF